MVEGEKMSKSKGNFFTARDMFEKGVTPAALRLELVRTHYRSNANFTMQGLADCQRQIDRWSRAYESLKAAAAGKSADASRPAGPFERALVAFTEALCDDLNIARAMAAINEALAGDGSGACAVREMAALERMNSVLGVFERNATVAADDGLEAKVQALLERRTAARAAKNWAESDKVRDELAALGVAIKDGPQGTTWSRLVK
jgi:cysteinyl-tRNA synthetase